MAFATTADAKLIFAPQTAWDSIPTSGYQYMRFNSESLAFAAETITSEEITTSRGVSDVVRTTGGVAGDIEFELAYDAVTDYILEGALQDTSWETDALKNGTTQQYFTIEKQFTGTAGEYFLAKNCAIAGLEVTVEQGALVMATASVMGSTMTQSASSINTATITAAGSNSIVSGVGSNVDIAVGGSPSSAASKDNVQSCSFAIDNGLREQRRIGSSALSGVGSGRFVVTGSLVMYFEDDAEYTTFMNETARQLELTLKGTDGKGYVMNFPSIKYTTAEVLASGIDTDIVVEFEWQALEHSTGTLIVTRDDTT